MLISRVFYDDIILLLVVIPLVMPLTSQMGVNIVQIGAIIVLTVGMGKVAPPWACSIFVDSQLTYVPYEELVPPRLKLLFFVEIPQFYCSSHTFLHVYFGCQ